MRRPHVIVLLVLAIAAGTAAIIVPSLHRRTAPLVSAPPPAGTGAPTGPSKQSTVSAEEPPIDLSPADTALARAGRPVVGVALAMTRAIPQAPLSESETAALGEGGSAAAAVRFPLLSQLTPVSVRWRGTASSTEQGASPPEREWLWATTYEGERLYVSPWGEVLRGGESRVAEEQESTNDNVLTQTLGGGGEGRDVPQVTVTAPGGTSWGLPTPELSRALRACYLASLGRTEEATEEAARAGTRAFGEVGTALAYAAHRAAAEGLADGWSRDRAYWTLACAEEFSNGYAGADRLKADLGVLKRMTNEDAAPPEKPATAAEDSVPFARYLVWLLRDSGGPARAAGQVSTPEPVGRLMRGGDNAVEALGEALEDDRMTRTLADDTGTPVPDVLRFGDLAFDILSVRVGREELERAGVSRLFALPADKRAAATKRVRGALHLREPR